MVKLKESKGITLVALIITIIVLLILAVVAISAVTGDGMINYAKNAKSDYQVAQINEEAILGDYLLKLERSAIQIGDKVAYDEGTGKTSTIDSAFAMDDMEWRVLDVEADGTIELISTKPTTSTLTISGEDGWLNAEENLDKLCSDLYANGTGVTARSLKAEDVNKLSGIITEEDIKSIDSIYPYGSLWRYKYDETAGKIQASSSTDNGVNWTNYANTSYTSFKEPGKETINSSNYKDENNNLIIAELKYTYYDYIISDKIKSTTSDGISIAGLITQGLNDASTEVSGTNVKQLLSSTCAYCSSNRAYFSVRIIDVDSGDNAVLGSGQLWHSYGTSEAPTCAVRPVVTIPASATLTKVDGVWQIEL